MDLYDIIEVDMRGATFASASVAGNPWEKTKKCPKCLWPIQYVRDEPLVLRWIPGSDVIPDLMEYSNRTMVVTERVKIAMEEAGLTGYQAWPVTIVPPKAVKPRMKIVPYPYVGPQLWDIYVTEFVHLIPGLSTVDDDGPCPVCGAPRYAPQSRDDQFFVVDRQSWNGCDLMRPVEMNTTFLSERAMEVFRKGDFTNVIIRKKGRVSDVQESAAFAREAARKPQVPFPDAGVTPQPTDSGPSDSDILGSAPKEKRTFLPLDEMPEYRKDLAAVDLEFPRLSSKETARHTEFVDEIVEYLNLEGDDVRPDELTFLRSAQVAEAKYWIWEYVDDGGEPSFAIVSERPDRGRCVGADWQEDLTPEQAMLADYHACY